MADLATVPMNNSAREPDGVARISGRITSAPRKFEKSFFTTLTLPAPDAFSHPAVVEVRSSERLGSVDDDVSLRVRIGGFNRKAYMFTDKESGEQRRVVPNNITLDVI